MKGAFWAARLNGNGFKSKNKNRSIMNDFKLRTNNSILLCQTRWRKYILLKNIGEGKGWYSCLRITQLQLDKHLVWTCERSLSLKVSNSRRVEQEYKYSRTHTHNLCRVDVFWSIALKISILHYRILWPFDWLALWARELVVINCRFVAKFSENILKWQEICFYIWI